jgi:hypothetical protein
MTSENHSGSRTEEFAVVLARDLSGDYHDAIVVTGPASVMLRPDATIAQYQDVIGRLATEGNRLDCVESMVKFLIGDILAQGEGVFGEDHACVYGVQLKWALTTINNIVRTAKSIPPEMRRISLSHRFYCDIAGANLEHDILSNFIKLAEEYKQEGRSHWRNDVLEKVTDFKVEEMLRGLPILERDRWYQLWSNHGRPHWRKLKGWIDGTLVAPYDPIPMGQFIIRMLDAKLKKQDFPTLTYEHARQLFADAMIDTAKAVRSKMIAAGDEK